MLCHILCFNSNDLSLFELTENSQRTQAIDFAKTRLEVKLKEKTNTVKRSAKLRVLWEVSFQQRQFSMLTVKIDLQ